MSDLYLMKRVTIPRKIDNKVFCCAILQPFQFEPEQKKVCGNEIHEKKTKHSCFCCSFIT